MKPYRAVVIGAGKIAQAHFRVLHASKQTAFAALADIDAQRAEQYAAQYGVKSYTDYKEMVIRERPHIVVITLPHVLHKEAVVWCMSQGCHVLVEKPMGMNERECIDMNEAAQQYGVVLAVGHMQHYYPAMRKAKEIIASGQLGKLVMIADRRWGHYFDDERPGWFLNKAQSGGGIGMNIGSHSIDKVQWLTDSAVTHVKAYATHYGERGDVEGSAALLLQTSSGVTANITLSGYRHVLLNETDLLFTHGQLRIVASAQLWMSDEQQTGMEQVALPDDDFPGVFEAQWDDLLLTIANGTPSGISGTYGQSVAAVVDALYRSCETGAEQQVISLQHVK